MYLLYKTALGLNCFSGGKGGFGIIDCPYFPVGDPKVCFGRTAEDASAAPERGCEFMAKLGGGEL